MRSINIQLRKKPSCLITLACLKIVDRYRRLEVGNGCEISNALAWSGGGGKSRVEGGE